MLGVYLAHASLDPPANTSKTRAGGSCVNEELSRVVSRVPLDAHQKLWEEAVGRDCISDWKSEVDLWKAGRGCFTIHQLTIILLIDFLDPMEE